jgi:hypothetical protein
MIMMIDDVLDLNIMIKNLLTDCSNSHGDCAPACCRSHGTEAPVTESCPSRVGLR